MFGRSHHEERAGGAGRLREEKGQTLVEYALIIAVVSLGSLVALGFLSGTIQDLFSKTGSSINGVEVAAPSGGGNGNGNGGGVPTGGVPTITPTGPTVNDQQLTAAAGTWTNNPTQTSIQWQRTDEEVDCAGAFSDVPGATNPTFTPSGSTGNNRCYRVQVIATNGVGDSDPAYSAGVAVVQDPGVGFNVSVSPTSNVDDGETVTVSTDPVYIASTYSYTWYRKNAGNCAQSGYSSFTGNGPFNTASFQIPEESGSQDRCYLVEVTIDNQAQSGSDDTEYSSGFFVNND